VRAAAFDASVWSVAICFGMPIVLASSALGNSGFVAVGWFDVYDSILKSCDAVYCFIVRCWFQFHKK
jgi:hypothetical protein